MKNIIQLIFALIVIGLFLCFRHFPEQFSQVPLFALVLLFAPFVFSWLSKQSKVLIIIPKDLLFGLVLVNCLILMRAPSVSEDFLAASLLILVVFSKDTMPAQLNKVNGMSLIIGQVVSILYGVYCFLMLLSL